MMAETLNLLSSLREKLNLTGPVGAVKSVEEMRRLAVFDGGCNAGRSVTVFWEDAPTRRCLLPAEASAAVNELELVWQGR